MAPRKAEGMDLISRLFRKAERLPNLEDIIEKRKTDGPENNARILSESEWYLTIPPPSYTIAGPDAEVLRIMSAKDTESEFARIGSIASSMLSHFPEKPYTTRSVSVNDGHPGSAQTQFADYVSIRAQSVAAGSPNRRAESPTTAAVYLSKVHPKKVRQERFYEDLNANAKKGRAREVLAKEAVTELLEAAKRGVQAARQRM